MALIPHESGQLGIEDDEPDEPLPVTSLLCKWNEPCKRKESNMPIAEAVFQKHVYGRQKKHKISPMTNYDPRPDNLRGQAQDLLKKFLEEVKGQGIGVSLMFDESCHCWSPDINASKPTLPSKDDLQKCVKLFKETLIMTPQEIEQSTRDQNKNLLWFSVRSYHITASNFGQVFHRKTHTPPNSLVLQILGKKNNLAQLLRIGALRMNKKLSTNTSSLRNNLEKKLHVLDLGLWFVKITHF